MREKNKAVKTAFLFILILSLALPLCGCSSDSTAATASADSVRRTEVLLDTVVTVTLLDGDEEDLDALFDFLEEEGDRLDRYSDSEIAALSTTPTVLSDDVFTLLSDSKAFSELSGDAFDPVLGALADVWQIQEPEVREAPSAGTVAEALSHSGNDLLMLDEETKEAWLTDEEAGVDLGASAKGYLGDLATEFLKERGVTQALLSLGGNIVAIGDKNGAGYLIGVEDPFDQSQDPIAVLTISDKSAVTSGDYQRYFEDAEGNRYHHILDPKTGYPADSGLSQVVVVSDSSEEADMLSTALFVMGKDRAIEFMKTYDPDHDIGLIFTEKDGTVSVSDNLKDIFEINTKDTDTFSFQFFSLS